MPTTRSALARSMLAMDTNNAGSLAVQKLTHMYGPAVRRKKFRRFGFRSCINVSGL
jgi:hypothetical protein